MKNPYLQKDNFWQSMSLYEQAPETTNALQLKRKGVECMNIMEMNDKDVNKELKNVIKQLGTMHIFLYNTDHLSNRELYSRLWTETLHERVKDVPLNKKSFTNIDFIGGGSDEDLDIMLKYYADDETRKMWGEDFPDMSIPEKEKAPYSRDKNLPRMSYH